MLRRATIKHYYYRFRSAVTGRFVSRKRAEQAPTRNVRERVDSVE